MDVLRKTRECVVGLDDLADAHFPRNYISADVQLGKLKHARKPLLTGHVPDRCMASISWDTAGPTQTRSINGYNYVTVFVCRYSMYYWAYGHHSTAQIPELFDKFYADVAHGPILSVRLRSVPLVLCLVSLALSCWPVASWVVFGFPDFAMRLWSTILHILRVSNLLLIC